MAVEASKRSGRIVGTMATFPARRRTLERNVRRIASQLDQLYLCLNEFNEVPRALADIRNVTAIVPESDYKDLGKFIFSAHVQPEDSVFLLDDDIIYPRNYVDRMLSLQSRHFAAVLGVHGVQFRTFSGLDNDRIVYHFASHLSSAKQVDALGTGTVLCKGAELPSFEYMSGSETFVDLRFAQYCVQNELPMLTVPRSWRWLDYEVSEGPSIYETVTAVSGDKIKAEMMKLATLRQNMHGATILTRRYAFEQLVLLLRTSIRTLWRSPKIISHRYAAWGRRKAKKSSA